MLITQVFVREIVLRADKDSTRTIVSTRNRHQEISVFFQWFAVFTNHVVQTKIQLIERQRLLCLVCGFSGWICVCFLQKMVNTLKQNARSHRTADRNTNDISGKHIYKPPPKKPTALNYCSKCEYMNSFFLIICLALKSSTEM